jgi:hypothetical protein
MLAEKNDDGENEEQGEEEVDAEVFGVGHWMEMSLPEWRAGVEM